jgi:hypothetical protein
MAKVVPPISKRPLKISAPLKFCAMCDSAHRMKDETGELHNGGNLGTSFADQARQVGTSFMPIVSS